MCELPHELLNDIRLRILGKNKIFRKSLKNVELMASPQPTQILTVKSEYFKKSDVLRFKEAPVSSNFANLPKIFCP